MLSQLKSKKSKVKSQKSKNQRVKILYKNPSQFKINYNEKE